MKVGIEPTSYEQEAANTSAASPYKIPKDKYRRRFCTETMFLPSTTNSALNSYYSWRFRFIRFLSVPLSCIPFKTPLIGGGRTLIELFTMAVMTAIGLYYVLIGFVPTEAGQITANVAAVAISCGFKNNVLTVLFGISYERAIYFHKFGSFLWIMFGIIHGVRVTPQVIQVIRSKNLLGLIVILLAGLTGSLYWLQSSIKSFKYEWFYLGHTLLFIAIVLVGYLHGALPIVYVGGAWIVDLLIRYYLCFHKIKAIATLLPCGVVKVEFPKNFEYSPGQFCFIMIPSVSSYQYHPFSISTAPHEENISFHIRTVGDWTTQLRDHVKHVCHEHGKDPSVGIELDICVEGPVGFLSVDLTNDDYKVVVLVSGGIGITPTQSIMNSLVFQHATKEKVLKKCLMVWSVRDKSMVDAIDDVKSHVTEEQGHTTELPVYFQPDLVQLSSIEDNIHQIEHALPQTQCPSQNAENFQDDADTIRNSGDAVDLVRKRIAAHQRLDKSTVFQGEFYLTNLSSEEDFIKSNIDMRHQPYLSFGRPNFLDIIKRVANYCSDDVKERGHRVAVVVCGPPEMVAQLSDICSSRHCGITFDLHHEKFEF